MQKLKLVLRFRFWHTLNAQWTAPLRGHDAQIRMTCHLFSRSELAESNAADLLKRVDEFAASPVGERILRGGRPSPPGRGHELDRLGWPTSLSEGGL